MKSKSLILMVVSLGFGLIAAIGISQVMGNNKQVEPTVERAQVLVAAKSLKNGDDLTEENVKIEHWPVEVIPEDAARSFDQIQHMKISTRLGKSLPILLGDTISKKDYRTVEIPNGYKLVAIKVPAEDSFYGLLQPGDRVDVIGIVTVREQSDSRRARTKTVSETFLKNIEVYTVDGRLNSAPREGGNSKNSIVGILVTEKQSEMIALVQKVARLKLVMRGKSDTDENWEEFTDYSQFYESVFGKEQQNNGDNTGTDVEEEPSRAVHAMRIYHGQQVQEVVFRGNQKMTPDQELGESLEESSDYDRQDENDSDLEEDQYRGE